MEKTQSPTPKKKKKALSKGFTEGINTLYDEIQLAFQWHRPSILLAIHNTSGGQLIAQQFLERKLLKEKQKILHIQPGVKTPDVIRTICSIADRTKTVFFVSGLENANQLTGGEVYRALNIHRENLVEQKICAVFWLTEVEAVNLPHHAPDLWAFRHRVVEFASQHGPRNPSVPSGLFLWREQLPWMSQSAQQKQVAYHEELLSKLPVEESATITRLDITLKLIQLNWQLNNPSQFSAQFENMLVLLKSYTNNQHHAWTLNAKGIKLFEDGDKPAARTCFDQALTFDPNNSILMMNSAILAHGTGKNREAILIAQRAVKLNPGDPYLWLTLGHLYLLIGKPQNAVEAVENALEKEPNNLDVQFSLAVCYLKNNQPETCTALLKKISGSRLEFNILQDACHSVLSGNIEEALTSLRQALQSHEINQHQILQNPNLRALLDMQNLVNLSE